MARGGGEPELATVATVPHSAGTFDVLGWLDDDHLAGTRAAGSSSPKLSVVRVNVSTGESQELVRLPDAARQVQLATDLLSEPTAPGIEPPSPLDPRFVAFLAMATLGGATWALMLWRRRVRP